MDNSELNYLRNEKIGKLMMKYAVPCIISLLVAALYNIVDQIFIGWGVGAEGNGATNIVFPLTVMALAIATMIGDGACSFVSASLGRRDSDSAHRAIGNAIVLAVASSLVLMAVYLIFKSPLLRMFGATDDVSDLTKQYASDYFFWISLGIPFYVFGQAMNPIIRSDGSPKTAMVATVAGAVVNVILDPIAIFVFDMGVTGAAIATVAGQIITAVISLIYLFKMKAVKLSKKSFVLKGRLIGKFIPLGFTSFLSQFSLVLAMAVINNMITKYGAVSKFTLDGTADIPLAVQGIVMKFYQIVISIVVGMAAGCIPIVGFNYGAKAYERCRSIMKRLLLAEAIVGAVALVLFQLFPVQLISVFGTDNPDVYFEFAKCAFRIYLCMMILDCVNKASFIFLQSLGKALASTLLSLIREVALAVPLAILMPQLFGKLFGMENAIYGLLASMPCSAVITFVVTMIIILRTNRQLKGQQSGDVSE
ncbi:MAG: MATE family efflux transporter [Oscillospiraceae bacterium]